MIVSPGVKRNEIDGSVYNTNVVLSAEHLELLHRTVVPAGEWACTTMRIEFVWECPPMVWTVADEERFKGLPAPTFTRCGDACTRVEPL